MMKLFGLDFFLVLSIGLLAGRSCQAATIRETRSPGPEGPPVISPGRLGLAQKESEPQPPSIDGIVLKAPAPPPEDEWPKPPAEPHPFLVEAFEKSPETFAAVYSQWQQQQQQQQKDEEELLATNNNERDGRSAINPKRKRLSYDQFVTAAIVTGELDIQRSAYTVFTPSDSYLGKLNISLPILALKDQECVRRIIRSHTVLGRITLTDGIEDVAMSLDETPIFFTAKEVNGVPVLRANLETQHGIVHIIDGLLHRDTLVDSCSVLASSTEGQKQLRAPTATADVEPAASSSHSITLRRVPDEDLLAGPHDPSFKSNELDNPFDVDIGTGPNVVIVPFPEQPNDRPDEANIPLELLSNIDSFAHAVKLTWQTEDNVIAVLQNLGASTFLALLERSHLMDTLTRQGPWTVFAPDNEAWQSLPKEIFDHIVSDPVLLKQILSYHVVQANATRQLLVNDQKLPSLYESRPIHINFYTDGWASWYTASGSEISNLDEVAINGVVHVVRSVLLPPLGDFYSVVKWTPALQTAFAMLDSVGDPAYTNDTVSLTAFLPADSPELDAILVGSSPSMVADILRRHVVRGTWFVSGLIDGDSLFTFDGRVLTVRRDADCVGINGACIAVRDITLTNGVLHVIDNLV